MNLKSLLENIEVLEVSGDTDKDIKSLALDSRKVSDGGLFFAVSGTKLDGHNFIDAAVTAGATAIICEKIPENTYEGVTYIKVSNTSEVVGPVAAQFFGTPSEKLRVVGVTGTNGKTTVATCLCQLFEKIGEKAGLLSTIENRIGENVVAAHLTTGDPVLVRENLAQMVEEGCAYAFMEVSSHAISQNRVAKINFAAGIFTNLSQDHLDYHGTMENYARAKKEFFDRLPESAFAIYNIDDERGEFMVADTKARKVSFGRGRGDFAFEILESSADGLSLSINGTEFSSPLVGEFNAYNLAAVFAAAVSLGVSPEKVASAMPEVSGARGRMQKVSGTKGIFGIVDYSHTPDALEKALAAINGFKGAGKAITVFGAGGDRDKTKRPLMGEVAEKLSDIVIVTSDNPRSEEPQSIINDILSGIKNPDKVHVVADRRVAIQKAAELASPGDVVLVAGKGHEEYQDVAGVRSEFSDKKVLEEFLK